ncbi:hypothetical protein MG293_000996 [Ovis ammon polii]|uniref:Uncharacterized protein n=1 Tax=Ovis ammon polii TaxID=230172 RepID=A0AAD4YIX3_OVIAM|nr:hypothetical protein MG293_000996 [Ovis ammon polii]
MTCSLLRPGEQPQHGGQRPSPPRWWARAEGPASRDKREEEAMSDVEERVDEYEAEAAEEEHEEVVEEDARGSKGPSAAPVAAGRPPRLWSSAWAAPSPATINYVRLVTTNLYKNLKVIRRSHTAAAKHANDLEASGKMQTWIYSKGFRLAMGAALKDQDCKDKKGQSPFELQEDLSACLSSRYPRLNHSVESGLEPED